MAPLNIGVTVLCLTLSAILYKRHISIKSPKTASRPRGYILENQVTHTRLLPAESAHSFTYPTVSLLLSLDALESRSLDIGGGWIFGYGGIWGRVIGLRSRPYLSNERDTRTIREKLDALLIKRGFLNDQLKLDDAWMMTMPSLMGFEGINPLTVYYCYKMELLRFVVLEVHNTFGEAHVYVLETGNNEDKICSESYDHQWTFPREFHVSPFNDRSGFYTVSIKSPTHPPVLDTLSPPSNIDPPRPAVRIHIHVASLEPPQPGELKLAALSRPMAVRPLTAFSLLLVLYRTPFTLFLSGIRIVFQAWKLHYNKRLDVFIRPEPFPPASRQDSMVATRPGGGTKWLSEGLLEGYARRYVESFLHRRAEETNITITLIPSDPYIPKSVFHPSPQVALSPHPHLVISYLSPRFFTILFLCPSASHAFLLGSETEKLFSVSCKSLFTSTFSSKQSQFTTRTFRQHLRAGPVPKSIPFLVPPSHILDDGSLSSLVMSTVVLWTLLFLDRLESWMFQVARARVVPGDEPWKRWERADMVLRNGKVEEITQNIFGSVRRDMPTTLL